MRTRFAVPLFIGLFLSLVLYSAEPPIQRQPWTTNTPGAWNAVGSNITFYRSDAYNRPFRVFSTNSSINTFLVNSNGTVGINTNIPQANLHVVGTTLIDGPFTNTTGNAAFLGGTAYFEDGIVVAQPSIMNGLTATNLRVHQSDAYNVPFIVYTNNVFPAFTVHSNSYVGIGTNQPQNNFHLFQNNPTADQILFRVGTSDSWNRFNIDEDGDSYTARTFTSGSANFATNNNIIAQYGSYNGIGTYPAVTLSCVRATGSAAYELLDAWGAKSGSPWYRFGSIGILGQMTTDPANSTYLYLGCGSNTTAVANNMRLYPNSNVCFFGDVGIGTNLPSARLTVKDNVLNSDAAAIDIANDAQTWRLQTYGTDNDDFRIVDVTDSSAMAFGIIKDSQTVYVRAFTNGVAPPTVVKQPIGLFASLKMITTNTVAVGVAGTYYNITNWTSVVTNGFTASTLGWGGGFVTNQYAGFYRISGSVAALPGNSDTVELEVFFNETQNKELASFGSYDNPARIRTLPLTGSIIYIPANTGISLRISNESDTDDIDVWRASLTIGTP